MCVDIVASSGAAKAAAEDVRAAFIELRRVVDHARSLGVIAQFSCIPEGTLKKVIARGGTVRIERLEYPQMVSVRV